MKESLNLALCDESFDRYAVEHLRIVGDAVSVSHAEGLVTVQILRNPLQASSRAGRVARIDQGDAPRLGYGLMHGHLVAVHVERHIRRMQEVVGKILLDDVALVPTA